MVWYPCEIETEIELDEIREEYVFEVVLALVNPLLKTAVSLVKNNDEINELSFGPVIIKGNYRPGDSGRTYGPMELCYPAEGSECEVMSINCGGVDLPDKYFNDYFFKRVIELLCERAESDAEEQYDDRHDK